MTFHELCGKEISARGFKVHCKHCTGKDWRPKWKAKKKPHKENKGRFKSKDSAGNEKEKNTQPQKTTPGTISIQKNILREINLKGEFDKMTETINPKNKKEEEFKYECGACHEQFNEKKKYCPGCGAEF